MSVTRAAAYRAAYAVAEELTEFDVQIHALAKVIRHELIRQHVEFLDRLNAEANRKPLIGPETECPV